ncbi:MAG: hypothetical protein ACHREM_00040 [Polyangiales bacterium]
MAETHKHQRGHVDLGSVGTPEMAEEACNTAITIAQEALTAASRLKALQSPVLRRRLLNAALDILDVATALLDRVPAGSGVGARVGHARDVFRDALMSPRSDEELRLLEPHQRNLVVAARAVVASVTIDALALFSSEARTAFFEVHQRIRPLVRPRDVAAAARALVRELGQEHASSSLILDTSTIAGLFDLQRALTDYDAAAEDKR